MFAKIMLSRSGLAEEIQRLEQGKQAVKTAHLLMADWQYSRHWSVLVHDCSLTIY